MATTFPNSCFCYQQEKLETVSETYSVVLYSSQQLFRGELDLNKADTDPVLSEQETSETKDRQDEEKDGSEKREEDSCTEKKNENEPSEIRDQDSTSAVRRNEFSILEVTR